MARVSIVTPSRRYEDRFLESSNRNQRGHRRWAQPPTTSKGFRELVERQKNAGHAGHLLIEQESGAVVGVANLNEIVRGSFESAYLGYYLFSPFEGRGLMSAGLTLVLSRAFRELRLHRVEANIQPGNERSIRLVKGLGFRLEGLSERYLKIGGRWRDHERWALLREEWRPRSAARRSAR